MGKIFCYDKPTLGLVIFLTLFLLTPVHSYASYSEYDLLRTGYESYLSYQPEKAAEEFRTFLQEFPHSSARDAALFWLGKSLLQAKSADEAGRVFAELKRQFPDSPFVAFIVTQTEPPESEKLTARRDAEPVPQVEASKDSAGIKPPEPAGKTADAIIEPVNTAVSSEMPIEKEAESAVQSSTAAERQISEPQPSAKSETSERTRTIYTLQIGVFRQQKKANIMKSQFEKKGYKTSVEKAKSDGDVVFVVMAGEFMDRKEAEMSAVRMKRREHVNALVKERVRKEKIQPSETVDAQSAGDKGTVSAQEDLQAKPSDGMPAKIEEPEAVKTELAETENREPALQQSEVIETAAELPPDAALPGNVPLDAAPVPENITAPEIVAITNAGEQETASPSSELPPEQAADVKEKIEEPGGKESEVKELAVKEAEVEKPEAREPEVKEPEVQEPGVREPEVGEPAQLQEDQATGEAIEKQAVEEEKELPSITEEQAQSENAGDVFPEEETPIAGDTVRRDDEEVKTLELSSQSESESDTPAYIQSALHKVGIQGAIWSTGDRNQDFIDEQILYNEAVKLNLSVDEDKLNELREGYALGMEEADYLKRFLLICTLIDRRVKEIPGEKAVEVLSVRYKDAGQRERPELSAELQALANKGVAFEDIGTSYPDVVHFKIFTFQELPEWIQERMQGLKNYEIGVIWSEEGYMILKPNTPVYSYDPFEELSSEKREKMTTHIRSWIAELKGVTPR